MLLPNRSGSTDSYRYGFQGQEKDDEIKGEGNSLNYKYRMHDPRVGRFFAVDPLLRKYPELTPYQFSSNRVIQFVELEGLEAGMRGSGSALAAKLYMEGKITQDELFGIHETRAKGAVIGLVGAADLLFTKGFFIKQLTTQMAVNTAVDGALYFYKGEDFNPEKIVQESFNGFDFADGGIDKGVDLLIDKYKIGKIKTAIKAIAPSLFDITIDNGIQSIGINKEAEKIITDIVGNILMEGVDKVIGDKMPLPTIKFSSAKKAEKIGEKIVEIFKSALVGVSQESLNEMEFKNSGNTLEKRINNNKENLILRKKDIIPSSNKKAKEIKK
jgi:RHS repeat-associated protein